MLKPRVVILLCILATITTQSSPTEVVEWTGGIFEYPNEAEKTIQLATGNYTPKNIIATRAQIHKDDIYVALPRFRKGVPVTLARVVKSTAHEAILAPYPTWAAQEEASYDTLQSVVDIFVDVHGILWALDAGVVNTLDSPLRRAPPNVAAFNLETGKRVKTLDLSGMVVQASRLQYVTVDYGRDGKPFVYVTDAATKSILVIDVAGGKGYRLVLPKATVGNRRDVLYAALMQKSCGNNVLIFTYLSGTRLFSIGTDYIRSGSAAGKIQDLGAKDGKLVILGTDGGTALFYRYEGKREIYRWDSQLPSFGKGDLVYTSPSCYFATQVMPDGKRTRMTVLESNFPDYIQGTVGCGASQRVVPMSSEI